MRITDLIDLNAIELNAKVKDKLDAIEKLVDLMELNGNLKNKDIYRQAVVLRELEGTTGIGEEIAIPHGKSTEVYKAGIAAMVIPDGVDFDSLDKKPVKLIFLIAAPESKENIHLDVLSKLSTFLIDKEFRKKLINAKSKEEFIKIIDDMEISNKEAKIEDDEYDILAITSCPTGIAHTYMAAESLEKKGKELGIKIKVETQGQSGVKNKLTKDEIKKTKGIIIAADTKVDLSRFDKKPLIRTKVADGIHKPEELINKILSGESIVYKEEKKEQNDSNIEKESSGRKIYKHLMNGVTYMLPFVVGGGILSAIAFLLDDYSIDPSNFGMNTPIAAVFKTIGGYAFDFMIIILAGYIASSIADRPGLVAGIVGGALAKAGTTFVSILDPSVEVISSGFLGALTAGFIAGYLILLLKKIFVFMPRSLEGLKTILIYPVLGVFLIGIIMLLINPYVSLINTGLNNFLNSMTGVNKIILGMLLGGMMSVDLGGPVNKAAYTFGTGMLAEGNYEIMAAVMAGGMVAPFVIAFLATFFPNKIEKKDRSAAFLNYVMGASFISEGAIPFASEDPIRVIPSCVIGSAIAGGLSMLFNCTLMAPHGGFFVIFLVGNPIGYIASILIGSVVGTLMLALLKRRKKIEN